MFIAYISAGIVSGIIAAGITLVAGLGLTLAFAAYVIGGLAGATAALLWMLLPQRAAASKHSLTQRS